MSTKAFAAWCAGFLVLCAAIGVVLKVTQRDDPRPEGVAERWLAAVSDTTRKGVGEEAERRVVELSHQVPGPELGPYAVAAGLVTADEHRSIAGSGKGLFSAIEVGRARDGRVPVRVAVRDGDVVRRTVVVTKPGDVRRVLVVEPRRPGERVPSEGGSPPSRAGAGLWVGAVAISLLLTVAATGLVRLAGRPSPVA